MIKLSHLINKVKQLPRVSSYTVLHYGQDYLPYSIKSILDNVQSINIVYTPKPSHGHKTNVQCPENEQDLKDSLRTFNLINQSKIHWFSYPQESPYLFEGQNRNDALQLASMNSDIVLVVDYDEVWHADVLTKVIDYVWQQNSARDWLINFTSLWRSFNWVVKDELRPVRLIDLRHKDGMGYVPKELGEIYHFGYAIRDKIMRYKWQIHGHKAELRKDWLETKWNAWPPADDCHPTNEKNFWMPEQFDKNLLPDIMRFHPFFGLEKIE